MRIRLLCPRRYREGDDKASGIVNAAMIFIAVSVPFNAARCPYPLPPLVTTLLPQPS
jgi:hypothetical protein